jgi:CheY-like chemotaxis protein
MTMSSAKPKRTAKNRLGCILVVEDDPVLALTIEAALLDAGAQRVVVCPSTASTLEALGEARPDGIVLDIHLADRDDGWALAELVEQLGPPYPRIVFSTGSPDEIPAEIAEMGPVFEKPYDTAQLVDALSGNARPGLFARLRAAIG